MMEEFKKLLMKKAKEQGPVDDKKMSAKAMIMKELSDMLGDGMKDDIVGGLKKVTVASDSPEGLEKGIELAKKKISELKGDEESSEEEEAESPEEEESEDESMEEYAPEEGESEDESLDEPAEIEAKIAELEKKLEELKKKKEE